MRTPFQGQLAMNACSNDHANEKRIAGMMRILFTRHKAGRTIHGIIFAAARFLWRKSVE